MKARLRLRWRRSRVALLAVVAAVVVPVVIATAGPGGAVSVRPAAAAAVARAVGPGVWVTLVTGDLVRVGGGRQVTVRPGMGRQVTVRPGVGREKVRFQQFTERGDTYVVPADAASLVAAGRLDRRLFDVTKLVAFGYDDRTRADLPLIVSAAGGPSTAAASAASKTVAGKGVEVTRELPSLGAVAVRASTPPTRTWPAR